MIRSAWARNHQDPAALQRRRHGERGVRDHGGLDEAHPELRRRRHQAFWSGPDPDLHGAQDVVGHRGGTDVSRLRAVGDEDRGVT